MLKVIYQIMNFQFGSCVDEISNSHFSGWDFMEGLDGSSILKDGFEEQKCLFSLILKNLQQSSTKTSESCRRMEYMFFHIFIERRYLLFYGCDSEDLFHG